MKRLLLGLSLALLSISSFGQTQKTVRLDTINVRGIVYTPDGKPAPAITLTTNKNLLWYVSDFVYAARTDSNGRFELKGLRFNDTITVEDLQFYSKHVISGSRFVVIELPAPKSSGNGIAIIKARRENPKPIRYFKMEENYEGNLVNVIPFFYGGKAPFNRYIQNHLIYPEKAIKNNIEGTVELAFNITRTGDISNIRLLKGLGYGCDEEAIRVISKAPRWSPGRFFGRPLESLTQTVMIQFKLTDK